jgi:hypothetical protein
MDTISEKPAASDISTKVCNDDNSIALYKQALRKVLTWIGEGEDKEPSLTIFQENIFSSHEGNGTVGNDEPFQNHNTFRNRCSHSGSYEC